MKTSHRSAGFILKEAMMALALSAALVVGAAQILGTVAQQRRSMNQYTAAVNEAGNRMEEVVSRPWAETAPEQLASLSLSEECQRCLPDGKLQVEVTDEDHDTRRIRIRIDWQRASGNRGEPVRLVGWKFRNEEARP